MSLTATEYYDEVVGLGRHCQLRWYLETRNLVTGRKFIFDDMISQNLNGLCDLLDNRFNSFFTFHNIKTYGENVWKTFTIRDEVHNIVSVHNFKNELNKESYNKFISEKQQQINNMLNAIDNKISLLFVRVNKTTEPLENTVRLLESLKQIRSGKRFKLIVFQEADFVDKIKGIPNLLMIPDKDWQWNPKHYWEGDLNLWNTVFKNIRLAKTEDILHKLRKTII